MKIAVQLFGHMRTFKKCYRALQKHLLSKYNCDVFIHTWDVYNHNTKTWHTNFKNVNKKVDPDKIMKIYGIGPEQIKIEHQRTYSKDKFISRGREWALQGSMSMYRSVKAVNALREKYQKKHKVKYDLVVCIRPDILLMDDFDLSEYFDDEQNVGGNNVYFPGRVPGRNIYAFNCIEVIDLLFLAKPGAMSKLCSDLKPSVKNGDVIHYAPDGFLVDNVVRAGLKPVFMASYEYGKSFKIKRYPQVQLNRSNIFTLHIRKRGFYLYLLRVLPPIVKLDTNLFGWFDLVISVGKYD